jgi:hypothetical protein
MQNTAQQINLMLVAFAAYTIHDPQWYTAPLNPKSKKNQKHTYESCLESNAYSSGKFTKQPKSQLMQRML